MGSKIAPTGLYYLQSRYYEPELGRFINADSQIVGIGGEVLGYNMFAYCMNNPVNMSDDSGNWPKWITDACNWVKNNVIKPVKQFVEDIKTDIKNYDVQNSNVNTVYNSNYFSSYKGTLVIRHSSEVLTSWASSNTIILNRNLNNSSQNNKVNLLNHEYGHILQEQEMGKLKYTAAVFLPSVAFNVISRFDPVVNQNYYNLPWEQDADWRGGVKRQNEHWLADSASSFYFIVWGELR